MKKLVIASTNQGKIAEITKILHDLNLSHFNICSLNNEMLPEPDEPYNDFLSNATHKATYYGKALNEMTLSDDSGLCIEALDGFPGVRTKEFLIESGGKREALDLLEAMLKPHTNYRAYYQSALTLYDPHEDRFFFEENKEYGTMTFPARGENGFGFDSIFMPEGYMQTMAELSLDRKNDISHRAKALKQLMQRYVGC